MALGKLNQTEIRPEDDDDIIFIGFKRGNNGNMPFKTKGETRHHTLVKTIRKVVRKRCHKIIQFHTNGNRNSSGPMEDSIEMTDPLGDVDETIASAATVSNDNDNGEVTLTTIDIGSILQGKDPVRLEEKKISHPPVSSNTFSMFPMSEKRIIPKDALLIEAPSFIVPYLFEYPPKTKLEDYLNEMQLEDIENTEDRNLHDRSGGTGSAINNFLMGIGRNLSSEYYNRDLVEKCKRKRGRGQKYSEEMVWSARDQEIEPRIVFMQKTVEIFSQKNEPFRLPMDKVCSYCGFQTESSLVLDGHNEQCLSNSATSPALQESQSSPESRNSRYDRKTAVTPELTRNILKQTTKVRKVLSVRRSRRQIKSTNHDLGQSRIPTDLLTPSIVDVE